MTTTLLTRKEKAKELNISERTIDRWIKSGKINTIQLKGSKRNWFLPEDSGINESIELLPNN